MNQNVISPREAAQKILETRGSGTVFTVGFYKRGKKNGEGRNEFREMNARLGSTVRKGLAGGPSAYDPREHSLLWVYIMGADQNWTETGRNRRSVPIDGIVELNIGGKKYRVSGSPHKY